jgi:hypothetical protein
MTLDEQRKRLDAAIQEANKGYGFKQGFNPQTKRLEGSYTEQPLLETIAGLFPPVAPSPLYVEQQKRLAEQKNPEMPNANWARAFLGPQFGNNASYPSLDQATPFGQQAVSDLFQQGAMGRSEYFAGKGSPFDISEGSLANPNAQNTAQRSKETAGSLADGYKAVADAMSGSIDMGFGKMVKDSSGKTSYQPNKGGGQNLASVGFQADPKRSYSTEKDAAGNVISISPLAKAGEDPLVTAQAKGWKAPGSEGGAGSPFTPNLNKFIASQNPDVMAKTMQGQNPSDVAQKDYAMKNVQGSKMSDIGNIQAKARTPIPEIPKELGSIQGSAPQINKPDLTSFNNKWKQAENKMMDAYRKNPSLASKDIEEIKKKKNPNQPNS